MRSKKIIFFDTTWNQLLRVGNVVASHIDKSQEIEVYGLVYETSGKKINSTKEENFFCDVLITQNINEVKEYIQRINPLAVVFAQNTMPDLYAIMIAKKCGAHVYMMQHGVLYDGASLNNVRIGEIFAAAMKLRKTLDYLNILRHICIEGNKSYLAVIGEILKKRNNVTTIVQDSFDTPLRGDYAFVIGEHWRDYYSESYGYDKNSIFIMGNHDVDDLKDEYELEDAICYIPSVHVEDGHVQPNVFNDFLEAFKASIPNNQKLYIKFHPRSDEQIYRKVFTGNNVYFVRGKELPYVKVYVGHNSSLLSKALQISGTLILWGFKEERELFFRDQAVAVCTTQQELSDSLKKVLDENYIGNTKEIEKYSYKNPVGAYKYCAQKIVELIEGEEK